MEYKGKYKKMADAFRKDGADEATIEEWICEEIEHDRFQEERGATDLPAWKIWKSWTEDHRQLYLQNAFCINCRVTSFAPGYSVRKDRYGLILEGNCAVCGKKIVRACD